VRLNLGCGDHYAHGWVNVDAVRNDRVRPDLVHDITRPLPLDPGSVTELYCGHVLEHLDHDAVVPALLMWRRYLCPGALVMVVGPDCDRADAMPQLSVEERRGIRFGGDRWEGGTDRHLWRSTEVETGNLLREAGFVPRPIPIEKVPRVWPIVSRVRWQFAIEADAPWH
jgi:hypothetical protein